MRVFLGSKWAFRSGYAHKHNWSACIKQWVCYPKKCLWIFLLNVSHAWVYLISFTRELVLVLVIFILWVGVNVRKVFWSLSCSCYSKLMCFVCLCLNVSLTSCWSFSVWGFFFSFVFFFLCVWYSVTCVLKLGKSWCFMLCEVCEVAWGRLTEVTVSVG